MRSIVVLLAAFAVLASAPVVAATTRADTVTLAAAKKKKHVIRYRRPATARGEIACGPSGCHRIPSNCHIQGTALDWRGNPTGIDAVYCR